MEPPQDEKAKSKKKNSELDPNAFSKAIELRNTYPIMHGKNP